MKMKAVLVLFALCAMPLRGQTGDGPKRGTGPSTEEERTRAIATLDDLEANPLGPKAKDEREWLIFFLIQVPDIHVGMCSALLPDLPKGDKKDSNILAVQVMLSSSRYAIQHGGGSSDSVEQNKVGVAGALRTYEALVKQKPEDRQPKIDDLLKMRDDGTLDAWVEQREKTACKKS